jgi:hypothetical protein
MLHPWPHALAQAPSITYLLPPVLLHLLRRLRILLLLLQRFSITQMLPTHLQSLQFQLRRRKPSICGDKLLKILSWNRKNVISYTSQQIVPIKGLWCSCLLFSLPYLRRLQHLFLLVVLFKILSLGTWQAGDIDSECLFFLYYNTKWI